MLDQQRKYDSYKDSGVPWIGAVPSEWEVLPGRACLYENKDKNTGMKEGTVLSLSYGRVKVKPVEEQFGLMPESYETYQIVRPGDVIIRGTDLQNDVTSLRTGLAKDHGIITSAYINLRPRPNILPIFLHYLLSSYDDMKVFYGLGSGLRQNLSYADFKYIGITVPDLATQNRIVSFLDEKTAEIDAAIEKKRRLIDLLNEQKAILINRAVTKGLNPDAPMKDSGVDWIDEIPAHWDVKQLRYISYKVGSGVTPTGGSAVYPDDGISFPRSQNVHFDGLRLDNVKFISEQTHREMSGSQIRNGDVLLNITGASIGRSCVYELSDEANVNQHVCIIRPRQEISPQFLSSLFEARVGSEQVWLAQNGASREGLNFAQLRGFLLPIPPSEEQQAIQTLLAQTQDDYRILIRAVEAEISTLSEFKQTLIANAVTGKIKI